MKQLPAILLVLLLGCWLVPVAEAARVSEIVELDWSDQALRFFSMQDASLRNALLGSAMMGICCGLLGSFIVVRKMAMMGDALSHAVLPGVALGFLWNMTKSPVAIFIGAAIAGLLGAAVTHWIQSSTRHKEDASLGFVLASFYALGICLMTMIQNLPTGQKSGLDKYLFGQAAALSDGEIILMTGVTILSIVVLTVFYKGFLIVSFDRVFAGTIGFPAQLLHYTLMLLLAFAVVVSLQAAGVVLVSAMLITPAAAAYLLTERLKSMLILAGGFGMLSGIVGSFLSFTAGNMPTGPVMVLAGSAVFLGAFLFGPRHGTLLKWWRLRSRQQKTEKENTLKAVYHVLEARDFVGEGISLRELAERRRHTLEEALKEARSLARSGFASFGVGDESSLYLTPSGWQRACEVVRNHRLWELYLTHAAQIAADHVHEDAEIIEHVLGEETVREIERRLNYAKTDPHGKLIPGLEDLYGRSGGLRVAASATGYGQRETVEGTR